MNKKNILVITHDMSLSGAPKSLLHTFEFITEKYEDILKVDVVSLSTKGELISRFREMSADFSTLPTKNDLKDTKTNLLKRVKRKIVGEKYISLNMLQEAFIESKASKNYDIIYANTIVSLDLAIKIKSKNNNSKILLHVHELSTVILEFLPDLNKLSSHVDSFIVPSKMNFECLENEFQIPASKIHLIRESSKLEITSSEINYEGSDSYNVIMCGGAYWRKGDDVFIQVANQVVKENPLIKFYWVGYQSDERKRVNELDIKKMNLTENVFFVGMTENPNAWLAKMDLFFLSSREDPFPLAAIEAGMFGLPICCFENASGISEIIHHKEMIAPYLDIQHMSKIILNCYNHRVEKKINGLNDRDLYLEFSPENIGKQTVELLLTF